MSSPGITQDNLIGRLTDRLFSAVSGDDTAGRPPLPAFVYDGRAFNPRQWKREIIQRDAASAGLEEYRVSYDSPDRLLRLALNFKIYSDYPVLEWSVELSAIGKKDTAEIDALRSFCLEFPAIGNDSITVRRNYGCKGRIDDFQPRAFQLNSRYPDNSLRLDTDDFGAASAWLPYFSFDFDECNGFELGIGWSGNWALNAFLDEGGLSLEVGMKRSRFLLHPGENAIAPSIYVMLRDGISASEAQLLHRRFLDEFHSPKAKDGSRLLPPQSYAMPGNTGQAKLMEKLDAVAKAGGKALEITRGWNGKKKGALAAEQTPSMENLGDWQANTGLYPNGFAPIADAAAKRGVSLMLWLELCSAAPKSSVASEHPDWFLMHFEAGRELLLNLGHKPARDWALDTLNHFVRTEKISHFVIPFPKDISLYWEHSEKSGRQGIVEAKFLAGWHELMGSMRRLFPDCVVQCNAPLFSDFEAISKCFSNCIAGFSDAEIPDYHQMNMPRLMHLAELLPSFTGIGAVVPGAEGSLGACLCACASNVAFPAGYIPEDFAKHPVLDRLCAMFRMDFHLLLSEGNAYAYQLHDYATGGGAVLAIGTAPGLELELNQIDTRAKYIVEKTPDMQARELKGSAFERLRPEFGNYENGFVMFYTRARTK